MISIHESRTSSLILPATTPYKISCFAMFICDEPRDRISVKRQGNEHQSGERIENLYSKTSQNELLFEKKNIIPALKTKLENTSFFPWKNSFQLPQKKNHKNRLAAANCAVTWRCWDSNFRSVLFSLSDLGKAQRQEKSVYQNMDLKCPTIFGKSFLISRNNL